MEVVAMQMGNPSRVTTKARRFAPEGVKVIAEVLERFAFADRGSVVLDWDDQMDAQPKSAVKPIIYITTTKKVDGVDKSPYVKVEVRLDVEDLFGNDNITAENIVAIVAEMEQKTRSAIEERKSHAV